MAPVHRRRVLPDNPGELEDALRGCRVMVRPLVLSLSRIYKALGTDPMDKEEQECCTLGFAAWMYEEGGGLSGRALAMMAVAGTALPRGAQMLEARAVKKAAAKREAQGLPPLIPPEVKGG